MLLAVPLLAIPFVIYNVLALGQTDPWSDVVVQISMVRGEVFVLTEGGLLLFVSLLLLFAEILKSTRTSNSSIVDHLLSTLVFVAALVEFLLVDYAATEVFFLLITMALIDVLAGFSITIRAARRDVGIDPTAM